MAGAGEPPLRCHGRVAPTLLQVVVAGVATPLALALALAAPAAAAARGRPPCGGPVTPDTRLNDALFLGTHNSYHLPPHPSTVAVVDAATGGPSTAAAWAYGHPPLGVQLGSQGVRQLELDVFADPAGGAYASPLAPAAAAAAGLPPVPRRSAAELAALRAPGLKVLHVQDVDYNTTVLTFRAALAAVRAWSDSVGGLHAPVAILIEAKEDPQRPPLSTPPPFDAAAWAEVEATALAVFGRRRLLTPATVRGRFPSLRAALDCPWRGWPSLRAAAGRVLLIQNAAGNARQRAVYAGLPGGPAARLAFIDWGNNTHPEAGVRVLDDPASAEVAAAVRAGLLVRTRADADTVEARAGDGRRRDAALGSGAHYVSTDWLTRGPFSDYAVTFGGATVLPNPLRCARRAGRGGRARRG